MTMDDLYKKYTLAEETIEFIGHAIALQPETLYRRRPALPTVKRIQLYYESLTRFAGLKSPYIYPLYGLGELPQVHCLSRMIVSVTQLRLFSVVLEQFLLFVNNTGLFRRDSLHYCCLT
jgi:RAB protein geranylgeranyltransferase component A